MSSKWKTTFLKLLTAHCYPPLLKITFLTTG